jgi:LmbE family N-acetylglucosaminyl deacetylase
VKLQTSDILARATAPEGDPAPVPKALLIFAHPDDEAVALGARLGRFSAAHFVHITDGAPRDEQDSKAHGFASWNDYRQARSEELRRALSTASVPESNCLCLDIPDQEASLCLLQLTRSILRLVQRFKPEAIFTHPYEGGHPDHDACAFAVHHAVGMRNAIGEQDIAIIEGTFYHGGPGGATSGSFLPAPQPTAEVAYCLTPDEQRRKQALMDCFATQRETLRGFSLEYERFRIAPDYDFEKPPHAGPVFYDMHPWGMTSRHFCELAKAAESTLRAGTAAACL